MCRDESGDWVAVEIKRVRHDRRGRAALAVSRTLLVTATVAASLPRRRIEPGRGDAGRSRAASDCVEVAPSRRVARRARARSDSPPKRSDGARRAGRARPHRFEPGLRGARRPRSRRRRRGRRRAAAPNSGAPARAARAARRPTTGRPAGVRDAGAEHQADRAGTEHRDRVPGRTPAASTPWRQHARGSTSAAVSGARVAGTGRRFTRAIRSGTSRNSAYAPFRSGKRLSKRVSCPRPHGGHSPHGAEFGAMTRRPVSTSMPQNSWPNRPWQLAEQDRVAAPVRLRVRAVGERDLDAHEHVAGPRLGAWHLLQPHVARPVEDESSQGVKTTLRRLAAAVELEPLGEALERQHGRLRELERGQHAHGLAHRLRRGGAGADERELATVDRGGGDPTCVCEDEHCPAGLHGLHCRLGAALRADHRSTDGAVRSLAAPGRVASTANTSSLRRARMAANTGRRSRGRRASTRRRHRPHLAGRRPAARPSSRPRRRGRSEARPACGACALGEASRPDRRRFDTSQVDSWPARQRSHSPHGR